MTRHITAINPIVATKCKVTGLTGTSRLRGKCSLRRSASATVQFFGETTCSPLMARSSASMSACISINLLRALRLVPVKRSGQHLRMHIPVLDHTRAGFVQRFKSFAH